MGIRKTFISGILINLLLISCGSSKQTTYPVKSYDETQQLSSTIYDDDIKLGYTLFKDNSHFYVTVNSQDKVIMLRMIRNGVTIFFDKEGKKNKDLSVQYPIAKNGQLFTIEKMKEMQENEDKEELLNNVMASLGTDIKITENGYDRIINKELNNESISVNHKMSLEGLSYTLKVPLSYIESQFEIKSIGISINGMKRSNGNNGGLTIGRNQSGGGRGGNGMRGGGRSGGMKGGRSGGKGNRPNMNQQKEIHSNIEIWIPIELE